MRRFVALALIFPLSCLGATLPVKKLGRWVEVRSPNFRVVSNAGADHARQIAYEYERARAILGALLAVPRLSPGRPLIILAVRDEKSMRDIWPGDTKDWKFTPQFMVYEGSERHFIVVRHEQVSGPYFTTPQEIADLIKDRTIFLSYSRIFALANYGILPFWLETGLVNFYGSTYTDGSLAYVGTLRPGGYEVDMPASLPLNTLLTTDRKSPLLKERGNSISFMAQATALVHYMIFAESPYRPKPLNEVVTRLHSGEDSETVLRDFLGDLSRLDKILKDYMQKEGRQSFHMLLPPRVHLKEVSATELSDAEMLTILGDFCQQGRPKDEAWKNAAREHFSEALKLEPQSADAQAGLGWLDHREGRHAEAMKELQAAVQMNPQSFIAQYYLARAQSKEGAEANAIKEAQQGLLRAIQLEPDFAPAYDALADAMLRAGADLDHAYALSMKAIDLDRGVPDYYITLARILLRAGRPDIAVVPAKLALSAAYADELRATAQNLLESIEKALEERKLAASAAKESLETAAPWRPELKHRPPPQKGNPQEPAAPKMGNAAGLITSVSCRAFAMDVRLKTSDAELMLHSPNLVALTYLPEAKRPADFDPCKKLNGAKARISFVPTQDKRNDGEILAIEVKK